MDGGRLIWGGRIPPPVTDVEFGAVAATCCIGALKAQTQVLWIQMRICWARDQLKIRMLFYFYRI